MAVLAQGHARPARALFTAACMALIGLGLLWLGALSDWEDWQAFFLWLILSLLGALIVGLSIYITLEVIRGFPKVLLAEGWLIMLGPFRNSINLDLRRLGRAHVIQGGDRWGSIATYLAFHGIEEEALLDKSVMPHAPTPWNATKTFPLTNSIGADLSAAQRIADTVNAYRQDYISPVSIDPAAIRKMEIRMSLRPLWGVIAIVVIVPLFAVIMQMLLGR